MKLSDASQKVPPATHGGLDGDIKCRATTTTLNSLKSSTLLAESSAGRT
jgi:hypothetical protein